MCGVLRHGGLASKESRWALDYKLSQFACQAEHAQAGESSLLMDSHDVKAFIAQMCRQFPTSII